MHTSSSLLNRGYEVVIGLETHVQLHTRSKIFSGASTAFGAEPNTQACAVDLALPGTLPVMNREAVEHAIRFGLAVDAKIAQRSIFARKNYFYPDLPKGYQISQYETPIIQGGCVQFFIDTESHTVNLVRAHLEEDAGKSLHEDFHGLSGIDLNRAGTPLLEIVTEPEMHSSQAAAEYARTLHALVVWLGICDGNMQEGSFRCDANVSVRRPGAPLGTRREIKNLNSFRFLQQAIDFEANWQIDQLEDGLKIEQATVLFSPDTGETRAMRSKEDAHDYRYFPDPDLPPLIIAPAWIDAVRTTLPELPQTMAERFQHQDGLSADTARLITQSLPFARYYTQARDACSQPKLVANWLMGEISRRLNAQETFHIDNCPVSAMRLAALLTRVADNTLSHHSAKQLFDGLWAAPGTADDGSQASPDAGIEDFTAALQSIDALINAQGLRPMNDAQELDRIINEVLAAHPKSVAEFRAGKEKAFNALVGQVMKITRGKAHPAQVNARLREKLA